MHGFHTSGGATSVCGSALRSSSESECVSFELWSRFWCSAVRIPLHEPTMSGVPVPRLGSGCPVLFDRFYMLGLDAKEEGIGE
jgi:hypothetical protein